MRALALAVLVLTTGCAGSPGGDPLAGAFQLAIGDSASIWYRDAGLRSGHAVVYLHGGPGYNSYSFEHSVGSLLEPHLRMIYLDQRGCGRSWSESFAEPMGAMPTVADLERLRSKLGVAQLVLVGHSFGGLLALEYQRAYTARVAGMILIDTTGDLPAAMRNQVNHLIRVAPSEFPEKLRELQTVAREDTSPLNCLIASHMLLGGKAVERAVMHANDDGMRTSAALDEASGLTSVGAGEAFRGYMNQGYLDSSHPELMAPLRCPAVLFAGRESQAVGEALIEEAASTWEIPVLWFEKSGHFIYLDESELFVDEVVDFVKNLPRR